MYSVSKTFSFCYGHRLVDDESKCRHLHGHTAKATIILATQQLDESGMVVHFDKLKRTIGQWLAEEIDHTMLLWEHDPLRNVLEASGERFRIVPFSPTAENLAKYIFEKIRTFGFPVIRVDFWESENAMASFGEQR